MHAGLVAHYPSLRMAAQQIEHSIGNPLADEQAKRRQPSPHAIRSRLGSARYDAPNFVPRVNRLG